MATATERRRSGRTGTYDVVVTNPDGEIMHYVRRTGRAELDEHAEPVSRSEYILNMNPHSGRGREAMLRHLLDGLKEELPGVEIEAEQPLAQLARELREAHGLDPFADGDTSTDVRAVFSWSYQALSCGSVFLARSA